MVRRKRMGERGAELIEFAIVFPILLLIVAGIADFGFMFQSYEVVTNAAREGARLASLPNYTTTDVQSRVNQYLASAGLTAAHNAPTVTVATVTLASGAKISAKTVLVTYPHTFSVLAPVARIFGKTFATITLASASTMRLEVPAS